MTTAEIIDRTQTALAYLEDGARETGLARLTEVVAACVGTDHELVVEALNERLKYCERRVVHAVEPDTVARWSAAVERLKAEIGRWKR
jgi:hypothetical protein